MVSDGAALNRWRLVLGKNAGQQIGLESVRLVRMDEALDFLYGREEPELIPRPALHSWRLSLVHPVTREPMTFTAPLPVDLAGLIPRWGELLP